MRPISAIGSMTPNGNGAKLMDLAIAAILDKGHPIRHRQHRIDPLFLHAIIGTESTYRASALSHAGARGLMQIMPGTGARFGVAQDALYDPATNIETGARLLKSLQKRYGKDFDLILAAYNAGEGAVARYGNQIPPYRETQDYVVKVMARYAALRGGAAR